MLIRKEGFDFLALFVSRFLFQSYITNDGSDFIVEEILKRKDELLHHNAKGAANGAALKKKSSEEVAEAFNRLFVSF